MIGTAHQRLIRERISADEANFPYWQSINTDISNAVVKKTEYRVAKHIILRYEWLGGMGNATEYYGIFYDGYCAGVTCFGPPSANASTNDAICGVGYGRYLWQLVRGACVHWAHPHSASKLISQSCRMFGAEHQNRKILIAYADERAGEIGTVYQATNWLYIGKTQPRGRAEKYVVLGVPYDPRTAVKKFGSVAKDRLSRIDPNWHKVLRTAKHQYLLWIGGKSDGRIWRKRISVLPYPKRTEHDKDE